MSLESTRDDYIASENDFSPPLASHFPWQLNCLQCQMQGCQYWKGNNVFYEWAHWNYFWRPTRADSVLWISVIARTWLQKWLSPKSMQCFDGVENIQITRPARPVLYYCSSKGLRNAEEVVTLQVGRPLKASRGQKALKRGALRWRKSSEWRRRRPWKCLQVIVRRSLWSEWHEVTTCQGAKFLKGLTCVETLLDTDAVLCTWQLVDPGPDRKAFKKTDINKHFWGEKWCSKTYFRKKKKSKGQWWGKRK